MSDDKYNELFILMGLHNGQDGMDAEDKALHLRDIARREDAEGVVEEFVSQWLSTEEDSAPDGNTPE